jgi:outer membrane protein assembly factor BamB
MNRYSVKRWPEQCVLAIPLLGLPACKDGTGGPPAVLAKANTRWYREHIQYSRTRPATRGNLVYIAAGDGNVIARDAETGSAVWTTRVANRAPQGDNMVVVGSVLVVPIVHELVGVDATSGQVRWRYAPPLDTVDAGAAPLPGQIIATRLETDGVHVFVPAWGASVSAVDASSGALRWVWQPARTTSDTAASGVFKSGAEGVAVSGDTVFVSAWHYRDYSGIRSEPWMLALDRASGRELWRHAGEHYTGRVSVWGAPVLHDSLVIQYGIGGYTWAVSRRTALPVWRYSPAPTGGTLVGPESRREMVYVDGGDGHVVALRAANGTVQWRAAMPAQVLGSMLTTERRVYVPMGQTLIVLDRANGRRIAEFRQPGRGADSYIASAPQVADGGIVVGVNGGAWSFEEP